MTKNKDFTHKTAHCPPTLNFFQAVLGSFVAICSPPKLAASLDEAAAAARCGGSGISLGEGNITTFTNTTKRKQTATANMAVVFVSERRSLNFGAWRYLDDGEFWEVGGWRCLKA